MTNGADYTDNGKRMNTNDKKTMSIITLPIMARRSDVSDARTVALVADTTPCCRRQFFCAAEKEFV